MFSAVVRPTPPGQLPGSSLALTVANRLSLPAVVIWSIVVPVPWPFSLALSLALKLLTSSSPAWSLPTLVGTSAIPYGFTSPLAGTVVPSVVGVVNDEMNAVFGVGVVAAAVLAAVELEPVLELFELP